MTKGTVQTWHGAEGWGVIDSPDIPGGCWTSFSHIWASELQKASPGESLTTSGGPRELVAGETVDFDWESVTDQDGYTFRAVDPRPHRTKPHWQAIKSGAYSTTFRIEPKADPHP